MAYLVFSWVKDVTTVVALDVGEDLVALVGNTGDKYQFTDQVNVD